MKRDIIVIDEEKCTGCGDCIPNCPEGAIQVIDGKARLVSDLMCDGLGACLGHCPVGAISVITREAEPYDEYRVMANVVRHGPNTIRAHLLHLQDHQQAEYFAQAVEYLRTQGLPVPDLREAAPAPGCAGDCGTAPAVIVPLAAEASAGPQPSRLAHWPVQMHLISPAAAHYRRSNLLLVADCVAYAMGNFHEDHLRGRTLCVACPKLDSRQEVYLDKLTALIDEAEINSLKVMIMQVPCCRGLLQLARAAAAQASRRVPLTCVVVGMDGAILQEVRLA